MTMHADGDSLAALAVISTIVQGVAIAAFPQKLQEQTLGLFFSAAVFGLLCNVWGKKTLVSRIEGNFRIVSSERPKKAVLYLKNKELARELSRGMDLNPPNLAYASKTGFLTRFLEQSYEPDNSEGLFRVIVTSGGIVQLSGRRSRLLYLTRDIFYGVDRIQCGNLRCLLRLQPRFTLIIHCCARRDPFPKKDAQ